MLVQRSQGLAHRHCSSVVSDDKRLISRHERLLLQRNRFVSDCGGVCKLRDWTVMAHQGVAAATVPVTFSTFDISVLVNGVPVCFLYYPVVWVVIDGVDVVAHNAARLSVFLR
jgi:hypothetical protein